MRTQTGAQAENCRSNVLKCAWKQFAQKKCANMQQIKTTYESLHFSCVFAGQRKSEVQRVNLAVVSGQHKQFPIHSDMKALSVCSSALPGGNRKTPGECCVSVCTQLLGQERKRQQAQRVIHLCREITCTSHYWQEVHLEPSGDIKKFQLHLQLQQSASVQNKYRVRRR